MRPAGELCVAIAFNCDTSQCPGQGIMLARRRGECKMREGESTSFFSQEEEKTRFCCQSPESILFPYLKQFVAAAPSVRI